MTELDTSNPRSLASMVTSDFRDKISNLPDKYINKSEHELMDIIQEELPKWKYSEIDFGLRVNFWDEYNWAQKNEKQMRMSTIYKGVCDQAFYSEITNTKHRLAYMITPFFDDLQKRRRSLAVLWKKMVDLAHMVVPVNDRTGVPDPKILGQQLDLFKFLYAYEHGLPITRIQQETKNLNYNIESKEDHTTPNMEDLDEKLRQLEAKTVMPIPEKVIALPVEAVVQEAGRVTEEFKR